MLAKRVESQRTVFKFRKRKLLCWVYLLPAIKQAREIRKFHVAAEQWRLRNVQKSVLHVQSC